MLGNEAAGVQFIHGGKLHKVTAFKEVIPSSGVIQTLQLLELSGIGDPEVLRQAGVQCVVENRSIGANFQGSCSRRHALRPYPRYAVA